MPAILPAGGLFVFGVSSMQRSRLQQSGLSAPTMPANACCIFDATGHLWISAPALYTRRSNRKAYAGGTAYKEV